MKTNKEKQDQRKVEMQAAAERDGFETWSHALTAWKNGEAHLTKRAGVFMKTVYAISRWSNSSRAASRHIDNGEGLPLCGGAGRKAFSWEREEGEPTCKRCVRLSNKACSGLAPAVAPESNQVSGASQ